MEDQSFHPYIPADRVAPEMTAVSVLLGAVLAIVFGAANAYLGLRVGMTISASIPAAVLSMGLTRFILKRDSILENNMVQTIGSAGESVAAGAIFTLPALFMWAQEGLVAEPSMLEIGLIALFGGVLGILFMIPLRRALIVKEHGVLAYPEGQACAEVLIAGEEGGTKASTVFAGLGIAAFYKFIADGFKWFPSEVHTEVPGYKGAGFGLDILPALAGVGYICGFKVSSYMFAGGVLAWFVIMPMIAVFGGSAVLFPAKVTVTELFAEGGSFALWSTYIRYIGAGAVLTGGLIGLLESLPLIIRTFHDALGDFGQNGASTLRTGTGPVHEDLDWRNSLHHCCLVGPSHDSSQCFWSSAGCCFWLFLCNRLFPHGRADRIVQQPCFRNGHCYPPGFHLTAQEYGQ